MRTHRIAVGSSLKGKIAEMGFFLGHILRISEIIVKKHLAKDCPLNPELAELNYFFSAYLNSIQALKDASQTAVNTNIPWEELSPTYGRFIYYCRNATTHDGSLMVNAGSGLFNYIVGPLRRIDSKGTVKEFDPPREDIVTLSRNIASEVLHSIKAVLEEKGWEMPSPSHEDLAKTINASMSSDFIPEFAKKMVSEKRDEIFRSLSNAKFDYAKDALNAIESLQKNFGLPIT